MTVEERESKFKAIIPVAVVALTDVLNCYAEVSTFEGDPVTIKPEESLQAIVELEKIVMGVLMVASMSGDITLQQMMPGVIALARRALQNAFDAAPGGLIRK